MAQAEETQEILPEVRIIRAFNSMPYGASAQFEHGEHRNGYTLTLEQIATNLERLRDVLVGVAERDQQTEQELRQVNADLGAWGRLMNRAQAQA